jgi:hypothetical protein
VGRRGVTVKYLILGHGRHGKDTVAEILRDVYGISFQSSSRAACEIFIYEELSRLYDYKDIEECYDDRINHREEWKFLITNYNPPSDKGRLCKQILENNDCYVGMRCQLEYEAVKHLFDVVFWVDALKRLPPDPTMTIARDESMVVIDNNGREDQLIEEVAFHYDEELVWREANETGDSNELGTDG